MLRCFICINCLAASAVLPTSDKTQGTVIFVAGLL
jgi:hypothetical protein